MQDKTEINSRDDLFRHENLRDYLPWMMMAGIIIWMSLQLSYQGMIWWCRWDTPVYFWTFDAWSKHTSQHLIDPYFFTHLLHGFLFLWGAQLLFRGRVSFTWLLLVAVFGESLWEVLENSPDVIKLYRANTASLDYFGDTIANSIGDVAACAIGFLAAYKLRFWKAFAVFFLVEILLVIAIRDSLLINILMLLFPIEAVKIWQTGG